MGVAGGTTMLVPAYHMGVVRADHLVALYAHQKMSALELGTMQASKQSKAKQSKAASSFFSQECKHSSPASRIHVLGMPCRIAMLVPTNHMEGVSGGDLAAWYAFQKKEEEGGGGRGLLAWFACLLACIVPSSRALIF